MRAFNRRRFTEKISALLYLKKAIIVVIITLACCKSFANDTAKINLSVILQNIYTKYTLGVYVIDNKEDNNIIDFKIITFPYKQIFYIDKTKNPLVKIFTQGVNLISDTTFLNLTDGSEYNISIIAKSRERSMELPEIIVSSRKNNNNDTISFKAEKFLKPNTFKTEDLISNIEGFRVDEDGKIYYDNKPISKVMINGDNLSGDNYTLITKNLNSKTLEEIQVIKNENNNRILSSIQKSTDVAINLVLKKQTPKLNPNFDIAFANKKRYLININALGLFKKIKTFSFFNTNTVADNNLLSDEESNSAYDAAEKNSLTSNSTYNLSTQYFLNGNKIGKPLLPSRYIENNKCYFKGIHMTYKVSKYSTLNAEIIDEKTSNLYSKTGREIYSFPNLSQQIISTVRFSNLLYSSNKYQLHFDYDSKSKLILKSILNYNKNSLHSSFSDLSKGSFSDELNEKTVQNKHQLVLINYLTYKLNTHDVLLMNNRNSFSLVKENLDGNTNRLNPFFNLSNNTRNLINQDINYNFYKNSASLTFIHSKKSNYNTGVIFENILQNPQNLIYFQKNFKFKTEDNIRLSNIAAFFKSSLDLSRNYNFLIDGLVRISKVKSKNFSSIFENKLTYGILTKFQTREKMKLAFAVSLNLKSYIPDINSLNNLNYLSSINQINYPSKLSSLLKENILLLSVGKRDIIKGSFSFNTSFFYNPKSISNNFIFLNGLFQNKIEIVNNNYGTNSILTLERYSFLFKSKFFLDASVGLSSLNQLQNSANQNLKILSNSVSFKTVTNFKKLTNFEIQILYNSNSIKQTDYNKYIPVRNYSYLVKNLSPISKKIMMGNTFKFLKYNNALPIYLQHLSLGYVGKKKSMKMELLLHNIWNYKKFSIIQNSFFNFSESNFDLVPRYLLLKTSFQL